MSSSQFFCFVKSLSPKSSPTYSVFYIVASKDSSRL